MVGWAVVGAFNGPWAIYRTADGGAHWTGVTPAGFAVAHQGAQFLDATTAVAATRQADGGVAVLHTADGGITWTATPAPRLAVNGGFPVLPVGLTFLDAQHGWLWTGGGGMFGNLLALYRTTDDGRHRTERATNLPVSEVLGFSSPTTGWATDAHAGSAERWLTSPRTTRPGLGGYTCRATNEGWMKFAELSAEAIAKIKGCGIDQLHDKHEHFGWEWRAEPGRVEFMTIAHRAVLLPVRPGDHADIRIRRSVPSADDESLVVFLTHVIEHEDDDYIAFWQRVPGEAFYLTLLYPSLYHVTSFLPVPRPA